MLQNIHTESEEEAGGGSASRRGRRGAAARGLEGKKSKGMVKWEGGRGWTDDREGGSLKERGRERGGVLRLEAISAYSS